MKLTKYGIFAVVALGGLMACAPIADAQTNSASPAPGAGAPTPGPRARRGGQGGLQAVLAKLDLTDDQKTKVKPVVQEQNEKMMALRQDSSLAREDRMAKMKEITTATDAKLKAILTPEQFTKFEDLRKQMTPPGRRPAPPAAGAGDSSAKQN